MIFSLFLVSCDFDTNTNNPSVYNNYNSVIFNIIDYKSSIVEGTQFDAKLLVKNYDGYPLREDSFKGKIVVSSFDKDSLKFDEEIIELPSFFRGFDDLTFQKTKASASDINENSFVKTHNLRFVSKSSAVPGIDSNQYNFNLFFSLCYLTKNKLTVPACALKNPLNDDKTTECKVFSSLAVPSQRSPVIVKSVLQSYDTKTKEYVFRIFVEKKTTGMVFSEDKYNACPNELDSINDLNLVDVNAKLFDNKLTCKDNMRTGVVELNAQGSGEIECRISHNSKGDYATNLEIELSFGHLSKQSVPVKITRP
jgi:hypothetical protein